MPLIMIYILLYLFHTLKTLLSKYALGNEFALSLKLTMAHYYTFLSQLIKEMLSNSFFVSNRKQCENLSLF